ncbi:MAG: hypothetical protein IKC97_06995 [Clostridia bacterium]|nr:hypothetical protein [Clostridia bacterium]
MPLRNPQGFPLSLSFGGYQKALSRLQLSRRQIKDLPPTASRLSFLATHRAALQSAPREKHLRLLCISRRQLPRAAGEGSEIVFVKKLVELGCVADGNNFCLLACNFRVGVFIENANAKAEDAYFCEKMSGATAERLFALRESKGH